MYLWGSTELLKPQHQAGLCHSHFLFHVDLSQFLSLSMASAEQPALQRWGISKGNVALSHAETGTFLELVVPEGLRDVTVSPQNCTKSHSTSVSSWWHPRAPWCTVWEPWWRLGPENRAVAKQTWSMLSWSLGSIGDERRKINLWRK